MNRAEQIIKIVEKIQCPEGFNILEILELEKPKEYIEKKLFSLYDHFPNDVKELIKLLYPENLGIEIIEKTDKNLQITAVVSQIIIIGGINGRQ